MSDCPVISVDPDNCEVIVEDQTGPEMTIECCTQGPPGPPGEPGPPGGDRVPFYLSDGTLEPMNLLPDETVPFYLSDGTAAHIGLIA